MSRPVPPTPVSSHQLESTGAADRQWRTQLAYISAVLAQWIWMRPRTGERHRAVLSFRSLTLVTRIQDWASYCFMLYDARWMARKKERLL